MKSIRIIMMLMLVGILVAGCSQETDLTAPVAQTGHDKDGTETLGVPSIAIASGSGFVEGGVGMVVPTDGILEVTVPDGATINQVLLYWAGGSTGDSGDDTIKVDGNDVTGTLIGGATHFFGDFDFYAYRADVTAMDWVVAGANSFTITELDFDGSAENGGVSMLVIYDDGTTADLTVLDGLDMAFVNFDPTLDATVPQTFTFAAEAADRMADLVVFVCSVETGRPNRIKVTTSAGDHYVDNALGGFDGPLWDSITVEVVVPAGDTSLTVEVISWGDSGGGLGASLGWIGTGLSVPVTPPPGWDPAPHR